MDIRRATASCELEARTTNPPVVAEITIYGYCAYGYARFICSGLGNELFRLRVMTARMTQREMGAGHSEAKQALTGRFTESAQEAQRHGDN